MYYFMLWLDLTNLVFVRILNVQSEYSQVSIHFLSSKQSGNENRVLVFLITVSHVALQVNAVY